MDKKENIEAELNSGNLNETNDKQEVKTKNKTLTIILIAIILILILAIGVFAGMFFAGDNTKIINNVKDNQQEEVKNELEESEEKKSEEEKTEEDEEKTDEKQEEEIKTNYTINIEKEFFSLKLPSAWENKYTIDIATGNEADTYVFDTKDGGYRLFGIARSSKKMDYNPGAVLLKQTNSMYYYFVTPTDTPSESDEYRNLYKYVDEIKNTVVIIDNSEDAVTQQEISNIENYLNKLENNGFVRTSFDEGNANGINVGEVLQDLSQFIGSDYTQEELKEVGIENTYVATHKFTTENINSFLTKKLGFGLEKIEEYQLNYRYSEKYDAYYTQHGDTSCRAVRVTKCTKDGNIYFVHAELADEVVTSGRKTVMDIKLEKNGDEYKFLSNSISGEMVE